MSYRIGPPPPPWKPVIIGDFFLSAAGAGTLLVAGAAHLARGGTLLWNAAYLPAPCIALSLLILVEDLGRPSRFWRMVRQLNVRSAMSWGSFILNGCFAIAGAAFLARFFGIQSPLVWKLLAAGAVFVAPGTLAYKGMLLSVSAVPPWRRGRLYGPLFIVDGVALGAAVLALLSGDEALRGIIVFASVVRALGIALVLWRAEEDRPLLTRDWMGEALGGAVTLSLVATAAPLGIAAVCAMAASLSMRAALLRAPYTELRERGTALEPPTGAR